MKRIILIMIITTYLFADFGFSNLKNRRYITDDTVFMSGFNGTDSVFICSPDTIKTWLTNEGFIDNTTLSDTLSQDVLVIPNNLKIGKAIEVIDSITIGITIGRIPEYTAVINFNGNVNTSRFVYHSTADYLEYNSSLEVRDFTSSDIGFRMGGYINNPDSLVLTDVTGIKLANNTRVNGKLEVDGNLKTETITLIDTTKSQLIFKNPLSDKVYGSMFSYRNIGGYDGVEISNSYHDGSNWYLDCCEKPSCLLLGNGGDLSFWTADFGSGAVTGWDRTFHLDSLGNAEFSGHVHSEVELATFARDSAFIIPSANVWHIVGFKDIHSPYNTEHYTYNADSTGIVCSNGSRMAINIKSKLYTYWDGGNTSVGAFARVVIGKSTGRQYSRNGQYSKTLIRTVTDQSSLILDTPAYVATGDTVFVQVRVTDLDMKIQPHYEPFENVITGSLVIDYKGTW